MPATSSRGRAAGRLIRLEVTNLLRDRRLAASLAAFCAVFALAAAGASVEVRRAGENANRASAAERARWLGQGEKDPHSAAHYAIYAFRPPASLEAVDRGIAPYVGQGVWLEAHQQNDLLFRPQQDATVAGRLGLLDPAGLLTRIGPLVVCLLAFAAVARDRERGLLAQAFGAASGRASLAAAKIATVSGLAVAAVVLPLAIAGAWSAAGADHWVRLALWAASASAFLVTMSAAAVCLCTAAASVQTAVSSMLIGWLALVLAAPPAATALADWRHPLPSFQQMKLVLVDEAPAYWTPETGTAQVAAILDRHGAPSEAELERRGVNLRGAQLDFAERHAQQVFDREIGGFYDRVQAQDAGYARLAWLSPAVAFDAVSAALAGTDFHHHRHFIDAAELYRRDLVNRMNADLIAHPVVDGRSHTNDHWLWSQVPHFDYRPLPAGAALRTAATPLVALGGWMAACLTLSAVVFRRVRP